MKKSALLFLLIPFLTVSQEYVDLFRIGYGQTFNNDFEGVDSSTNVKSFDVGLTFPVVLNENHALITGADFSSNTVQLYPDAAYTDLYSSNLKLGLASNWSKKWSTTVVLLPKLASNYTKISTNDFYLGGFAVMKLKKKKNLIYRFGFYASQEAFGLFSTPILGWYYLSPNNKFEMDMSLPISADVSYTFGRTAVGIDYFGIGRSYRVYSQNFPTQYVDLSSLDFAGYLQYNILKNSVLLRAKVGYSSNNFEMYADDEKIDLGISAFNFGDDRTQLNPSLKGGIFLKFEAIYRFHIKKSQKN